MSQLQAMPSDDELLHSHSDLTRQVEELVAHARALRTVDGDEVDTLLSDLDEFACQFATSVRAHIVEEEQELFPRCQPHLTVPQRAKLERIRQQHRDLEESIDKLLEYLDAACQADELDVDLAESVYVRARLLRYTFNLHSNEERGFFEQLIEQNAN